MKNPTLLPSAKPFLNIYLAWAEDELTPCRCALIEPSPVLDFSFVQKEGEEAKVLTVIAPSCLEEFHLKTKKAAFFFTSLECNINKKKTIDLEAFFQKKKTPQERILFKGFLTSPICKKNLCLSLEFSARPLDARDQIEGFYQRLKEEQDPLFFAKKEAQEDVYPTFFVPYFDPVTHTVETSHIFEGRKKIQIAQTGNLYDLKIEEFQHPIQGVEIVLEAQWIQKETTVTDIGPDISGAFPQNTISTYTSQSLTKNWPKPFELLSSLGTHVVASSLKETRPPFGGFFQKNSQPITQGKNLLTVPLRAKRYYFQAVLFAKHTFQQKRVEWLTFVLKQNIHPAVQNVIPSKKIFIRLNNIHENLWEEWDFFSFYQKGQYVCCEKHIYVCKKSHESSDSFFWDHEVEGLWTQTKQQTTALLSEKNPTFFVSERGKKAFHFALDVAKYCLGHSARAFCVSFKGPWETLCHITLEHTVRLQGSCFFGRSFEGKVIRCEMIASGQKNKRYIRVTFAVSAGIHPTEEKKDACPPGDAVYEKDYGEQEDEWAQHDDIVYRAYGQQLPQHMHLWDQGIVERVVVHNDADKQEKIIQKNAADPCWTFSPVPATQIYIKFHQPSLETEATHNILVEIGGVWSAPQHLFQDNVIPKKPV